MFLLPLFNMFNRDNIIMLLTNFRGVNTIRWIVQLHVMALFLFDNIHCGRNNCLNSCGCHTHIKLLGNYYSSKLSMRFNNCYFWHNWWSCVKSRAMMFHSMVTPWYPLWCRMWMWIHLWFFILGLNRWMNLLILWSQLASQLHAF